MNDLRDHLLLHAEPLAAEFVDAGTNASPMHLGPLGFVNILVGANSAGKSRLMRGLAARSGHVLATGDEATRIANVLEILARHANSGATAKITFGAAGNPQTAEIHPSTFGGARDAMLMAMRAQQTRASQRQRDDNARDLSLVEKLATALTPSSAAGVHLKGRPSNLDRQEIEQCVGLGEMTKRLEKLSPKRILIPALRSAQTLWQLSGGSVARLNHDVFASTFAHRYGAALEDVAIWTGADLYDALIRMLCARKESREMKLAFERFLARTFFPGRHVELVPQLGPDLSKPFDSHVNFVLDGIEHALFEVGDGIGAITTLLFPLFNAESGSWAFIEEPENHLHPAYQRTFLEALLSDDLRRRGLRIFLTTHSNHLLDIAMERPADISVLSLSQRQAKLSIRHSQGRDVRVLDTLGVRNSSVYLANCSIWVEGPTDVTYLRAFLEIAMIERYGSGDLQDDGTDATFDDGRRHPFQEDLHFAFLEYGGSLLANYDFGDEAAEGDLNAAAIANRLCIIADRDVGKDQKHERWRARADASEGALLYLTTTGREIENELSPELVVRIVTDRLNGAQLPEGFDPAACGPDDYLATFLAAAFANHPDAATVARWKKSNGGTFESRAKRDFANLAAEKLRDGPDATRVALLGARARKLAMDVLDFVEGHNKGVFATKNGTPRRG